MGEIKEIKTIKEWENVLKESEKEPVFIFKHSTRCGISSNALREYTKFANHEDVNIKCYLVDIIENRSLSNTIARHTSLKHESPQILLIKNSLLAYNSSHNRIRKEEIIHNLKQNSIM